MAPAEAIHSRRALILMSIDQGGDLVPLAQEIFDGISIAIVEGDLAPGDVLDSVSLARRFGTSRTPAREALLALERQGVVVVPPRRRPYIAKTTLGKLKQTYQLRAALYSLASELVVESRPKPDLNELWAWQRALEDDAARNSVEEYFWHNVGFRLIETRLSGNEELQRHIGAMGLRTLQYRHISLSQQGRMERSIADHRRLLEAYQDGDRDMACAITRALVMAGYEAIARSGLVADDLGTERSSER